MAFRTWVLAATFLLITVTATWALPPQPPFTALTGDLNLRNCPVNHTFAF